jgi:uncharacterized RmlC-like cupin family protein
MHQPMSALPPLATSNTLFPWRRPPGLLINCAVGLVPHLAQDAAPFIRYVISGELHVREGGQETVYKAGEYFYETGNIAHAGENKTNLPLRLLVIEILPKDWTGPAVIPPKS